MRPASPPPTTMKRGLSCALEGSVAIACVAPVPSTGPLSRGNLIARAGGVKRRARPCARRSGEAVAAADRPLEREEQRGGGERDPRRPQLHVAVLVHAHDLRRVERELGE